MIKQFIRLFTGIFLFNILCAQFSLQDSEADKTVLHFTHGDVSFKPQGDYAKLIPSKGGTTTDYGRPELPLFSTLIQVESDKEYSVSFSVLSSHTISDIMVFPFQNKDSTEAPGVIKYVDASFYEKNAVYPESILEVSDRLIMRDLHLLNIRVVPYRYNPSLKILEVLDEVEIEVTESGEREDEGSSERLPSRAFEKLYSTLVLNYEERSRDEEFQYPAILYICGGNSENNSSFQQLVEWRHQRGYVVYTASLGETGSSSNAIKNYILNAYNSLSVPPEYVALVGDVGGSFSVPTFYESWGHNDYGGQCEGDHPYSQLDGTDLLPEVLIGRISIRSSTEMAIVVNKILNYEKGTYASSMLPYFEKAALVGDPNSASGYSTVITNEYIAETMNAYGMEDVRLKISGGGWASWMQNQLDEGVLYFNYRGIYGVSGFDNGDIDAANNGFKLPFATVITCGTGSFAQDYTSMSEKFLRAGTISNPKGGIAGIATATWNTHTAFNNIVDMGIYDGIFVKEMETAGGGLAHGKLALFNAYPTNPYNWVNAFTQWNNLMGDPATHLWTDTPENINVQFEPDIPFGTNFLDVHVNGSNGNDLENALVTLLKDNDEIFLNGFTDQNGNVSFDLNYNNGGEINIAVTKRNIIPFISTIEISTDGNLINIDPSQEMSIEDGTEGNGILNPGETVDIQIPLKNFGLINVSGIQAVLESTSPFVTLVDNSSNYGTISSGESSSGEGFTLSLEPSAIDGEDLGIRIHITDDSGEEWIGSVPLLARGGYLIVENDAFVEKNQTTEIQVSVQNNGTIAVENVLAELIYNGESIEILDSEGAWGTISPNETVVCSDCFTIHVGNNLVNGSSIPLSLRFYNADGYDNQQTLTLQVGEVSESDPLGPDAYGYYIYDMADTGYNIALEYDWIEIDPDFGGPGTDLYISDSGNGNFSHSSETVELPFTFRFYGVDYVNMSVNSNGWISMGETDMESFRNYPVPGAGGPSPMIAAFWDDLKTAYGGDVIQHMDPDSQFVIIEWSEMRTQNQNSVESFQVILYNSQVPPFGDGNIKIQYKIFNNTSSGNYIGGTPMHGGYCTIGIENHLGNDGLEYTFSNNYAPAATELEDGSALLITTSLFEEPTALFEFAIDNYTVFFSDLSMVGNFIDLTEWIWDFGDGNTSTEPSPIYYYSSPGTYQVNLVVTSSIGLESDPYVVEVTIDSCTDSIDDCGVCGGSNAYLDCNGQCGEWTPICTDENFAGYVGPTACEDYIGVGSDYFFSDNGGLDECGECEGNNSSCTGCTEPEADNYDPFNIFEDSSCTYVFYGPGYAVNFDGEDDNIEIIENNLGGAFDEGSDEFTFSAWVYPDVSGMDSEYEAIVSYAESSDNGNFAMGITSYGNIEVFIKNSCGDNLLVLGGGEIQPGEWHYIAITFSSGNVTVFINGNVYADQTCGNSLVETDEAILSLGSSLYNNNYFNGVLDEVRIWNYAREIEDIQANMYDGIDPESDGLMCYLRFDETEGETTFDGTSGNNDGILIGSPGRIESTAPFTLPPFITLIASADTDSWPVELKIGMFPEATEGYDFWVDRYAPPPPPPPTWDAAIYNTIIDDRLFTDIRPVPAIGEVTEWAVDFQPDVGTEEITLSWDPDELVEGNFILSDPFEGVVFSVDMGEMESYSFSSSFTRVILRHSLNTGMMVSYTDGWNLLGLPLAVSNASYSFLFPESVEETLYSYNGGYSSESELIMGNGYWLRFSNEGSSTISGSPINELTLVLNGAWNLISGISVPVSVYSILDPDSIVVPNTLFGFTDMYSESEIIIPGEGYWLRAFQDGEITLTSDATTEEESRNFRHNDELNILSINGSDLFFGVELSAKDRLSYSLPPKPPATCPDKEQRNCMGSAFDIRFKGEWRLVKDYGEIEVMSLSESLTISYEIKIKAGENQNWVLMSESGDKHILEESGELTIPFSENFYLSKELNIPNSFSMHQNFPNPFNPITTITYGLPIDIFVKLTIFDMLGREISKPVNEQQKAGIKSVQWDATDRMGKPVSAGVYLYQIEAGDFIQIQKLVLLK